MSASLPGEQADDPVSAQPGSAFIETETIRLHYLLWQPNILAIPNFHSPVSSITDEANDDEPPIVLLHGLGATADTWRLVAPHLSPHHQVIAFDLRGHGESDCPDHGYDLVTVAEDIVASMAALGLGQVILAGHGWGARVALTLAARHPALICHLVLVDCPLVEPRHWPGMTRQRFLRQDMSTGRYASRQTFLQSMQEEMAAFWSPPVESIMLAMIRTLPDGSIEERLAAPHQRQIR